MKKSYEPVVGFEIHIELKTASKMFCGCKNDPFFAAKPNIYTCPVCLGLPGALPVPNKKAIEWTIMLGLALGCKIPLFSKFDRKHYFYPDLPKGYQISQYDQPMAVGGKLSIGKRTIGITRVHLEEDTAKLLHITLEGKKVTLVDFNRSGVPLVEIVSEPDIRTADEAKEFLKKIHQIVRYLEISDADMEKGSMRIEPNISVRAITKKKTLPPYKVEVKNINSFNFVKRAIDYEVTRQTIMLEKGETPVQENRGWNEERQETVSQRGKEEAADYRYFPDPDIPPLRWTKSYIATLAGNLPELPGVKEARFLKTYGLTASDASQLVETKKRADFFEEAAKVAKSAKTGISPKEIANWIINRDVDVVETLPAGLIKRMQEAKTGLDLSSSELEEVVASVLKENAKAASDFKAGKQQALMFLLGAAQRKLKGKAPVPKVLELLKKKAGS